MASRVGGFLIDCSDDDFEEGVRFWSAALGVEPQRADDADSPYVGLPGAHESVNVELQRIDGPSRYHLDLVADDVEAEATRLEGLGATRVEKVDSWWVLRAPTGHLLCVVPTE